MAPKIEWGQKGKVDTSAKKDHQVVKYRQELLLVDSSGFRIIFFLLQKTHSIEVDTDTEIMWKVDTLKWTLSQRSCEKWTH